ncbi:MAG: hypothetical protein VR72_12860 [Clostridiaceae bacterium BRH_c20a]|nr:MAG: hypothetical protein VR72_12860 [Clostridiaceae bacterium BRH_c20a]
MLYKSYSEIGLWSEIIKLLPIQNQIKGRSEPVEVYTELKDNKVHLDCYLNPAARAKVILLHGVGGNGRLLSFIGVPLHIRGFEVIAPDIPGYGLTIVNNKNVDYAEWIHTVNDLIDREFEKDDRPIFLFGLSAGGMLAYQVACINKKISGLIATNILDQSIQEVRDASAINKYVSRMGVPMLGFLYRINNNLKLPMRYVANMRAIVNDKKLLRLLISDKTSSGAMVSVRFMLSLLNTTPAIEPEEFDLCPFLLAHPEDDKWTPMKLSLLFFNRLKCEKKTVILENAGHFPIEQPGIIQLEDGVVNFINDILDSKSISTKNYFGGEEYGDGQL